MALPKGDTKGCRLPNKFLVEVGIRLINRRSGKDKTVKEDRDEFIRQLKVHVCALRNTGGGTLWIHIKGADPSDKCLEYFHELVDERLNSMIPDGSLFVKTCQKQLSPDRSNNTAIVEFIVLASEHIVTLDFKTKEPLDNAILPATSAKINHMLTNRLTFKQSVPVVRGLYKDMDECRDVQMKSIAIDRLLKGSLDDFIQYIWDGLKLKYCITAFSKLEKGGSFYLGIRESCVKYAAYSSKQFIPTGFKCPKDVHVYFINALKDKVRKETTVLLQKEEIHVFTQTDLIEAILHPICPEESMYVLEVTVAPVEGIVFYDREGPEAYEVDNRSKIRRITKERWYQKQYKLATGDSSVKERKPEELTANMSSNSPPQKDLTQGMATDPRFPAKGKQKEKETETANPPGDAPGKSIDDLMDEVRCLQRELEKKNTEISILREENTTLRQTEDLQMLDSISLGGLSLDSGQGSDASSLASWRSSASAGSNLPHDSERRTRVHGRWFTRDLKKHLKHDDPTLAVVPPTYIDANRVHVYVFTDSNREHPVLLHCRHLEIAEDPVIKCYVEGELLQISTTLDESTRQESFRVYCATFGTSAFPLCPPTPGVDYWEARVAAEIDHKDDVLSAHLEVGVSDQEEMLDDTMLYKQTRSWCICVAVCGSHHNGVCIQIWRHGNYESCITNVMAHGESKSLSRTFGIILDMANGKLVFTDAETGEILKKFREEFRGTLFPVFGVLPSSDKRKIEMRLITGKDVTITRTKQQQIYACLQEQETDELLGTENENL